MSVFSAKWYISFLATCGGLGWSPYAPGTVASFAALFFWYLIFPYCSLLGILLLLLMTMLIGWHVSERVVVDMKCKDPAEIVIDEWFGMGIALAGNTDSIGMCIAAFICFRVFDIFKPFPIKEAERLVGGLGVMADDGLAGIAAAVSVFMLRQFLS